MKVKSIRSVKALSGKTVLLRVAYDVPLAPAGKGFKVADVRRITETLPIIEYLLRRQCKIVLLSWLKRPGGRVVEKYRLDPVARALSAIIKKPVKKLDDCIGPRVFSEVQKLKPGQLIMLENVRFYEEEEKNSRIFAALLAHGMDLMVFDAFAQAHRVHASTVGIQRYLPTYAGFLLEKELQALSRVSKHPKRPLVVVLGGAKISDKVYVLEALLKTADRVLLGGGLANVFTKAKRIPVGNSFLEDVFVDKAKRKQIKAASVARRLLKRYRKKLVLPVDFIAANEMDAHALVENVTIEDGDSIHKRWMFLDIGPRTIAYYLAELKKAKTIFFNGPMGVFEIDKFSFGTKKIAQAIARSKATTVVGGGDTEMVLIKFGLSGKFTHVSTGGGASLEFLGGRELPALKNIIKMNY